MRTARATEKQRVEDETLVSRRAVTRQVACVAVSLVIVACAALVSQTWGFFSDMDTLRTWIASQGALAPIAMVAVTVAQIVFAVLPGEPVELAAGYLFGFWEGTALCLAGALVGTLAVVALVKAFGMRVVGLFFSREQVGSASWLRDSARLETIMFVVFLVPGTPKDALTYAAALTSCPWWKIALITTIGRIPSVASSTLAAEFAAEGHWAPAVAIFVVMVLLAIAGGALYAKRTKRDRRR